MPDAKVPFLTRTQLYAYLGRLRYANVMRQANVRLRKASSARKALFESISPQLMIVWDGRTSWVIDFP